MRVSWVRISPTSFIFLLRTHLFVLAPLSETVGGVGTIRPLGSRCRRFGRDPRSVSRVASLLNIFGLGYKANPRVSATSPGMVFLHPLSPCTHVRFGFKPGFSARRWYTYISLLLHRATRYDPAAQQPSRPLAAAACNSIRVWLLL